MCWIVTANYSASVISDIPFSTSSKRQTKHHTQRPPTKTHPRCRGKPVKSVVTETEGENRDLSTPGDLPFTPFQRVSITMNIFRLSADMLHVVSIFLLLLKIKTSHSCAGISLKTQILYMTVFSTRYLDLFFTIPWHSPLTFYNTIMKILFITSSAYTIYLIQKRYKHTYDKVHDTFRIEFLLAPSALLALIFHLRLTLFEIIWAFSVFLESLAILPQLSLLQQTGEVENITSHYIFCLGGYRALYILNWIWRYFTEHRKNQWLAWACGTVQTILYADFFYYYYLSRKDGKKLRLPP